MKDRLPLSTIVLWSIALILVVVLVLTLIPRRADAKRLPPLSRLSSSRWRADTAGGRRVLEEIGWEVTGLRFSGDGKLLYLLSNERNEKVFRPVIDEWEGCVLFSHTCDSHLRLTYEEGPIETLLITGVDSHGKLYFLREK